MEVPGVTYFTLHDGEPAVMGVMQMDEQWAGIPPHWMPYFAVADLDAANATFQRHGGTLMHGPIPSPYGRIMVVKDAQGAVFSYMAAVSRACRRGYSPDGSCGTPCTPPLCSRPALAYTASLSRVSMMSRLRIVSWPMRSSGVKNSCPFSIVSRSGL